MYKLQRIQNDTWVCLVEITTNVLEKIPKYDLHINSTFTQILVTHALMCLHIITVPAFASFADSCLNGPFYLRHL